MRSGEGFTLSDFIACTEYLKKKSWTADQEWLSSLGVWARLTKSHSKIIHVKKYHTGPRNSADYLERP